MPSPQLSVRSAHAKALAHRLAKKERRTVSQVVERALELYAKAPSEPSRETAAAFWNRLHREGSSELDLQAAIEEGREAPRDISF